MPGQAGVAELRERLGLDLADAFTCQLEPFAHLFEREGLADPPGAVRRELEALAPIELLDGPHETEVALLDEVEHRQAGGLVPLRDRRHGTKIRFDEPSASRGGGRARFG